MEFAASLNNIGVAAIELGQYDWALALLKRAISAKLKDLPSDPAPQKVNITEDQELYLKTASRRLISMSSNINIVKAPQQLSQWNGAFIYQRAVLVPPQQSLMEMTDSASASAHASIVLYNLALVHHLKAACNGFRYATTKSAVNLYKMALELLRDSLHGGKSIPGTTPIIMATLNNLGQLFYELGNLKASRECFANLSNTLLSMVKSGQNIYVDEEDWAGMIMNTALSFDLVVAPAA